MHEWCKPSSPRRVLKCPVRRSHYTNAIVAHMRFCRERKATRGWFWGGVVFPICAGKCPTCLYKGRNHGRGDSTTFREMNLEFPAVGTDLPVSFSRNFIVVSNLCVFWWQFPIVLFMHFAHAWIGHKHADISAFACVTTILLM